MTKKPDLTKLNKDFDAVYKGIESAKNATKGLMPLVSKSLELTLDLITLYKKAFNQGLKK